MIPVQKNVQFRELSPSVFKLWWRAVIVYPYQLLWELTSDGEVTMQYQGQDSKKSSSQHHCLITLWVVLEKNLACVYLWSVWYRVLCDCVWVRRCTTVEFLQLCHIISHYLTGNTIVCEKITCASLVAFNNQLVVQHKLPTVVKNPTEPK